MRTLARSVALWVMVLFITALLTVQWSWTAIAYIGAATVATFVVVLVGNLVKLRWAHAGKVVDDAPGRFAIDLLGLGCALERCHQPATRVISGDLGLPFYACAQHVDLVRGWVGEAS